MENAPNREQVLKIIFGAVEEINGQLPASQRLLLVPETVLVGESGSLDSLGLISLFVALEMAVLTETGRPLKLVNESLLADADGPFHTIESLTRYIIEIHGR